MRISSRDWKQFEIGRRAYGKDYRVYNLPWELFPRQVAVNANAAVVSGNHPLLESVSTGTTVYTHDEKGFKVAPGNTQYNCVAIVPAIQTVAASTVLAIGVGTGSTARNGGGTEALAATFKTRAATKTDSGRGIGFSQVVELDLITDQEWYLGMAGAAISALICPATTTKIYTGPDDGFGFYFNPAVSANWLFYTHSGSNVDTAMDTKIPVVADKRIHLEAYLDNNRYAHAYINGSWVGRNSVPVDASTALGPYIAAKGTAASTASRPFWLSSDLVLTVANFDGAA